MKNHDELSYIKISTKLMNKMSDESIKMKREIFVHRIILIILVIITFIGLI